MGNATRYLKMAEADFIELAGGALTDAQVRYGYSANAAFSAPDGSNVLGFQALDNVVGFRGLVSNVALINPTPVGKGGDISACIRKYDHGLFTPCIFMAQGLQASSPAYILGLSEETPHKIILRKGPLNAPTKIGGSGNLSESDDSFLEGPSNGWHELRLSVCVNPHGEVILQCLYDSALGSGGGPAVPTWSWINGMHPVTLSWDPCYVDDTMGIVNGSPALKGGFYFGIGHYNSADAGHISLFDYLRTGYQTAP